MATLPGKKTTDYTPATNITDNDIFEFVQGGLNKQITFSLIKASVSNSVEWNAILNKPTTFPPSAHTQEISTINGLQTALDAKAADSTVVKLTGDQNVSGVKTFAASPIVPNPTTSTQVANKDYVDGLDGANVKLTGDQTIAGVKTFSVSPVVPAPALGPDATNRTYVDTLDATNVKLTGAQTIADTKTFSAAPIISTASANEFAYFGTSKEVLGSTGLLWSPSDTTMRFTKDSALRLYNTTDRITNTEYARFFWNANAFYIDTFPTGTGVSRPINLSITGTPLVTLASTFPLLTLGRSVASAATSTFAQVVSNFTAASGTQLTLTVIPTIAQSGTAGWTALEINPSLTSEGSGNKLLTSWKTAGTQYGSFRSNGNFTTRGFVRAGSGDGLSQGTATLSSAGSYGVAITPTTANLTLGSNHATVLGDATSGNIIITLPAASGSAGRIYNIKKIDSSANTVTIDANATEVIDANETYVLTAQWQAITIQSDGVAWFIIGKV